MSYAIKFQKTGVRFRLYHEKILSFQDLFVNFRKWKNNREDFWALREINFEIPRGQIVGIIGQNGSGKSTLLRTIVRVIEPTEGKVLVNGRAAAMIELTAGFDPELTGRENIYLSGSLYGFTRKQIDQKYDHIVEFSELEHFIDIPVKNYSSGMYAKLGLSISIEVDPDILIIDEVLAVGDVRFREKCLNRLDSFMKSNKTIVIVSHQLDQVKKMCQRAILLDQGRLIADGAPNEVTEQYLELLDSTKSVLQG